MKNFKKMMAIVIVAVMTLMYVVPTMAATGSLSVNTPLTVSGLDEGDTVTYYQVLKWDPDNSIGEKNDQDTNKIGWVWADGVNTSTIALPTGITLNGLLRTIVGTNDGTGVITGETAGILAAALGTASGTDEAVTQIGSTDEYQWTKTVANTAAASGLYLVIVTPATPGVMYNPIFVAANWVGDNETPDSANSIEVKPDTLTYSNNAMAKKSSIPLEKDAVSLDDTTPYTADVDEELEFTVGTTIPKFGSNYTDPVFKLHDVLKGLELTSAPVVYAVAKANWNAQSPVIAASNYDLDSTGTEYTIKFKKTYLDSVAASGQPITVKYKAKVTKDAEKIVNQEKNTVDLIFSTTPNDTTGKGILRDETNHYTFSIDAGLLGDDAIEGSSTEAIKVGRDKEGNIITSVYSDYWSQEKHAALEEAEFTLYKSKDGALNKNATDVYTNSQFNGTVKSDARGRITIKGLDVGEYWLLETKAPTGFVKMDPNPIKVTITADIDTNYKVTEEVTATGETQKVTYITNILNSYNVTFGEEGDGQVQTSYAVINLSSDGIWVSSVDRIASSDKELINTKGVELPSTGGMGTTLFYIIGAILIIGAGVLLVTRRRASVEK